MSDVLVVCQNYGPKIRQFPQVRGIAIAKFLRRLGVDAEFAMAPLPKASCKVLLYCEYQSSMEWFDRKMRQEVEKVSADRMFCVIEDSLGSKDHFSKDMCLYFASRGGVLCHLDTRRLAPYEHHIGVGVDPDVLPRPAMRERVLLDFRGESWKAFDESWVQCLTKAHPMLRFVGSGPPDAPLSRCFDEWVAYGQSHPEYVAAAFGGLLAYVTVDPESMGLALAEAQASGACVIHAEWQVKPQMLCPEASIPYVKGSAESVAAGITQALGRDSDLIRKQAAERFDWILVAQRIKTAIGL
jgi:hypothetical protein